MLSEIGLVLLLLLLHLLPCLARLRLKEKILEHVLLDPQALLRLRIALRLSLVWHARFHHALLPRVI